MLRQDWVTEKSKKRGYIGVTYIAKKTNRQVDM